MWDSAKNPQEKKSTNPDTEKQTQKTACIIGHKENSSKENWKKIIKKGALFVFLLILIMYVAPYLYGKYILSLYKDNLTAAGMHITIGTNLIIAAVTYYYVLLTKDLVTQSEKAVTQSKNAVAQSRKEQQIRDIENRLEKFYIPAEEIINGQLKENHEQTINGGPHGSGVPGLKQLRKYSYLADKTTYEAYEKYIMITCESIKSITCVGMYRDVEDYKCVRENRDCKRKWNKCDENLEKCEHFIECPTKDQDNIIINNAECKYYKILKKRITEDIINYKEDLFILKK